MPDEKSREKLWRNVLSHGAPVCDDIDYLFLAKQFELSGGDIRNIVLEAAFLAASHTQLISMPEIVQALARHQIKQGKAPSSANFKQYNQLIMSH